MRSDKSIRVAEVTAFVMNWITVRMSGTCIGAGVVHPDVAFGIAALVCEILDRIPDSDLELPPVCDRIVDQLEVLAKAPGNVWFADEDGCTTWVPHGVFLESPMECECQQWASSDIRLSLNGNGHHENCPKRREDA